MKESYLLNFRCPDCHSLKLAYKAEQINCNYCGRSYPVVEGRPVLIRSENEIFPPQSYINSPTIIKSRTHWSKKFPNPSVNLSREKNLRAFVHGLSEFEEALVLVVGSGKQKPQLSKFFSDFPKIELVYSDIDSGGDVDLFCDAHELPFNDQVFQGVIITAVLEHVLYPEVVVGEIYRVLAKAGLIYSEVPFIQQVHAGAYDFTRYTLSGHRRLFNHFRELSGGLIAGPGTALVWSIENFALCFAIGPLSKAFIKGLIRTVFFWLKYFDYLFRDNPQALDGASCTYFLGAKGDGAKTPDIAVINSYSADREKVTV